MPVTDREFESLMHRVADLEQKLSGLQAQIGLVKWLLPFLISAFAVGYAVYSGGN